MPEYNKGDKYAPRAKNDFYPTPAWVTKRLLKVLNLNPDETKSILEPCAGKGSIVKVLEEEFPKTEITAFDLIDYTEQGVLSKTEIKSGVDFLKTYKYGYEWVITNPPFSLSYKFLEKSLFSARNVALLLPAEYISGIKRSKFFTHCSPSKIIVIPERIDFLEQGSTPQSNHCWFVWELENEGNTEIIWATEEKTGVKVERVKPLKANLKN